MTSTAPLLHMYADSGVRFNNPFVISKDRTPPPSSSKRYDQSQTYWGSHPRHQDPARALTPPPEMTGVQPPFKPVYYQKEHGQHYGDYMLSQQTYRAPVAPYLQQVSNTDIGCNAVAPQVNVRVSPIRHAPAEASNDAQRRGSQANAIAANFQIPRSVNDSGGSLSELAAQITCLFWFESSEILQHVENSPTTLQTFRPLTTDAKPTTGFRKWVTTILSTTMVAQNVVILALLFIHRLKKLNPTVRGKPGSEYRLLTVALMLGNKFLDDNTYTNKTWAEVSGINVAEVHIMEVEFLSNMKYCLFTSEQDWAKWQHTLGKFAAFFHQASRPQPPQLPAPILPPASSLHLPLALPSPPASNQASPPYLAEVQQNGAVYSTAGQHGPTPAPSPLGSLTTTNNGPNQPGSRKRSIDDYSTEPHPKRIASNYQTFTSPSRHSTLPAQSAQGQSMPRLTLPSLSIPTSQASSNGYSQPQPMTQSQQLPPLSVPARAMAMVYPNNSSSQDHVPAVTASAGSCTQPHAQPLSQYSSRTQSPYGDSAGMSPTNAAPQSATALQPTNQISPTYFLQQRNSPYRPVHHVSTLLYPPPSGAIQSRPPNIQLSQMQYQPLGRTVQHTGRLPYVAQNLWLDGHQPQEMTPIHQWPGFSGAQQQQHQHLVPQQ